MLQHGHNPLTAVVVRVSEQDLLALLDAHATHSATPKHAQLQFYDFLGPVNCTRMKINPVLTLQNKGTVPFNRIMWTCFVHQHDVDLDHSATNMSTQSIVAWGGHSGWVGNFNPFYEQDTLCSGRKCCIIWWTLHPCYIVMIEWLESWYRTISVCRYYTAHHITLHYITLQIDPSLGTPTCGQQRLEDHIGITQYWGGCGKLRRECHDRCLLEAPTLFFNNMPCFVLCLSNRAVRIWPLLVWFGLCAGHICLVTSPEVWEWQLFKLFYSC